MFNIVHNIKKLIEIYHSKIKQLKFDRNILNMKYIQDSLKTMYALFSY